MRFILKQSAAFASMLSNTMEKSKQPRPSLNTEPNNKGKKRAHEDEESSRVKSGFVQPALITGATLKDYQLDVR